MKFKFKTEIRQIRSKTAINVYYSTFQIAEMRAWTSANGSVRQHLAGIDRCRINVWEGINQ